MPGDATTYDQTAGVTQQVRRRREAGFTLVELLVVLIILGLIAAFAAPRVIKFVGGAKTDSARIQIERLSGVLDLYRLQIGRFPSEDEGLNALALTTETLDNRAIAEAAGRAQARLAKGEGLAEPLMETGVFPGLALQLIRVGEETGQLDQMLLRIAVIYDDEVKRTIERMLSLLVPLVTRVLGVLIAAIIGSMMAAILSSYDLPF